MRIELPFPPPALNPNRKAGKHWAATHAVKAGYRHDCWVLSVQAARGYVAPEGDIPLRVTFVQPDKRRRDRDNLLASCKAALDSVAAALKVDDSRFEPVTISRTFGAKPGMVVVEVAEDLK